MGVLVITKAVVSIMIGFLGSVFLSLVLIPILKKYKIGQNINEYVSEKHKKKQGTPTMGGIIFILTTLIATLALILFDKLSLTADLRIVLFTFISYAIIGILDDILSIKNKENEGLKSFTKFTLQMIVAFVVFYLYLKSGGSTALDITALNIKIEMGWLYGPFIFFILVGASNAVNLTDGLDGLAASLSFIALIAFSLISLVVYKMDLAMFLFIFAGAILGFLFFNTYPARVFMGDSGSLTIGAVMGVVAILTHKEITLFVVALVFVIETLSVILQYIWLYVFKKKLFLMTPLHHHFEKLGYKESDIVKIFVVVGLILAMAGIYYGVWL